VHATEHLQQLRVGERAQRVEEKLSFLGTAEQVVAATVGGVYYLSVNSRHPTMLGLTLLSKGSRMACPGLNGIVHLIMNIMIDERERPTTNISF
jgi:hypothetical protein